MKIEEINDFASKLGSSNTTVLIYKNFKKYFYLEPLAVYEDSVLKKYNPFYTYYHSLIGSDPPGIQECIDKSYGRGRRIGAICRDGTRISETGREACNRHGGAREWIYSTVKNPSAIIGIICNDYILKSGESSCKSGLLLKIRNDDLREFRDSMIKKQKTLRRSAKKKKDKHSIEVSKIDENTMKVIKGLNEWVCSDSNIPSVKVVLIPVIDSLPSSLEKILHLVPADHRYLIKDLRVVGSIFKTSKKDFDPTELCQYNMGRGKYKETINIAKKYFNNRVFEVVGGHGESLKTSWFDFDWYIAFDPKRKLLYSFILNLHD